jgi:uncharacterized membrane protein YhaH (DUF805 family)
MNSFLRARYACVSFLTRAFDFTGRTNRFDFWIVVLVFTVINTAIDLENTPNTFQNVYLATIIIPWLSLIARRLRDSGYNLKWLWNALIPFYILFQIWNIFFWLTRPSQEAPSFSQSKTLDIE